VTGPVSGSTVTLTYDGYGRVRTSTTPDGVTLTMDYDAFDRPTRVTYPDGTYEAYTYNRMDLATHRDRQGRVTRMYYDDLGRLTGTRDPLGRTVQQIWGESGAIERLIDAKGQTTSWVYDLHRRVTSEARANGTTTYTYEPIAGRLKTVTDPKGQVSTYAYGQDDSLTSRAYSNATIATPTVSYTYDLQYPRVATMVDGQGTTTYTYKPVGQLGAGAVATLDGPQANDTQAYTYDQLGRVVTRTLNGTGVTWAFDALGRTTSAVNPLGTFTYTYDGLTSRLATATYPNGQTSTYSYFGGADDRRLPDDSSQDAGRRDALEVRLYLRHRRQHQDVDAAGRRRCARAVGVWLRRRQPADLRGQGQHRRDAGRPRLAYRYDTAGNRTEEQIDDALTGATHNASNQLTSQQPAGVLKVAGQLSEAATVTIDGKPATVDATNRFTGTKTVAAGANVFTVVARDAAGNTTSQTYDLGSSGSAKAFTYDPNGT